MPWKRPESVPYPSVWLRFKAKDCDSDEIVDYVVQDLPDNRFDDAIKHMVKHFVHDEPMCSSKGLPADPVGMEEIEGLWRKIVPQRCAIVCFKENSDEIVGLNMLVVSTKEDKDEVMKFKSQAWDDVYQGVMHMLNQFDVLEHYGVDAYVGAMGLSVLSKYRGRGIATEILRARIPFCKAVGVKLTTTVFTAIGSQIPAKKVGFEDNYEESYEDLAKRGPHLTYPGIKSKSCKLMSLKVE